MLLDANPIDDVANLDEIAAVFLKDKYLSKDALEKLKSDVADAYGKQPLRAPSLPSTPATSIERVSLSARVALLKGDAGYRVPNSSCSAIQR